MSALTLAGMHATGALIMIMGIFLAWAGLPEWKPGETLNLWDGGNPWMIVRGLALAIMSAPLVMATGVAG